MMRNLFIIVIVLIVLLAGAFIYLFYTPVLALKFLPENVEKFLPDGELRSLQIGGQFLDYPETLRLTRISGELGWKGEEYQFTARELNILDFWATCRDKKQAKVSIVGLNILRKNFEIKDALLNAAITLDNGAFKGLEGNLQAGEVNINPYRVNNANARLKWDKAELRVSEIKADAYGGKVTGELQIGLPPKNTEITQLEFQGLKSAYLETFNKPVFSQLNGEFSGSFRVSTIGGNLQALTILADMSRGATISSALVNKILGYMTDEQTRYDLLTLMEDQSALKLDKAEFRILNLSQNLASVTFTLENKKHDLRVQETVNIDIARILQKITWRN